MKLKMTIGVTLTLTILFLLVLPEPWTNKELTRQFWYRKTHTKQKYDIVVCGDSRVYRGISTEDLTSHMPPEINALNLGYGSAGLSSEYLDFACSKLDMESKFKTLLIGVTPHSLTLEANANRSLKRHLRLEDFEKFRYRYLSGVLKHFAPYRPVELVRGEVNYQETYMEDGWVASSYLRPDSSHAIGIYGQMFSKYGVSDTIVDNFVNKVEQLAASGITVLAFRPPSTMRMRELEDSLSGFDEVSIARGLSSSSITWLDFPDSDFESYDGSHLEKESAKRLSSKIGEQITMLWQAGTEPKEDIGGESFIGVENPTNSQ